MSNHGQNGVILQGINSTLANSTIEDTGCRGVFVTGGDAMTLNPGRVLVNRNRIRCPERWKWTYMAGLEWGGVKNTFRKCVDYCASNLAALMGVRSPR